MDFYLAGKWVVAANFLKKDWLREHPHAQPCPSLTDDNEIIESSLASLGSRIPHSCDNPLLVGFWVLAP
ncbi:MAG: hypothetical protein AAFZ49_14120 [Cyanobacteria bacterium J06659_2]